MKIIFFYNGGWMSSLTKYFTGSTCYHVGFLSEQVIYDMYLSPRKRPVSGIKRYKECRVVLSPVEMTQEQLEKEWSLLERESYGFLDYLLFSVRPIFHLFGRSTPNARGMICSEVVYNTLLRYGELPFQFTEIPSPADLERVLLLGGNSH